VPLRAETSLKMTCYYLRHCDRVSRSLAAGNITLDNIRAFRALRTSEQEFEKPDETPKIDENDMITMIDNIKSFLGQYLGETKIPLAYVIREDPDVTPENNNPATNYSTKQAEMIARAPHYQGNDAHPTFTEDNHKVWALLANICRNTSAWRWVRGYE
jgi:hypothetical protein